MRFGVRCPPWGCWEHRQNVNHRISILWGPSRFLDFPKVLWELKKLFDDKWKILVTVMVILVTKILHIVINITLAKFSNQLVIFIPVLIFSFAWFPWWTIENCWVTKAKIENKILIIAPMKNSGWWSGKKTFTFICQRRIKDYFYFEY